MRKFLGVMICFLLFLPFVPAVAEARLVPSQQSASIDASGLGKGVVSVKYASKAGKQGKAGITKNGKTYYYDLPGNGAAVRLPLQMQNGMYKVTIFEQTKGNEYMMVASKNVSLQLKDSKTVFLQPVQNVHWTASMAPIKTAANLTKGKGKTEDKIKAIHNYVIRNVKYDFNKMKTVQSGYVPNINTVFAAKKGICYDYAALFGAMLRSQGVPTKLVTGYSSKVQGYHAWNEVYIKEQNKWVIVDTTVDASSKNNSKISIYKKASEYKKMNEY
ncbi:transglutaminase domain-containing protein [Neobacillus notoginsengisoli]|uniref:Transglutaminase domain-containing protein n=1 Tax=Neobacillus notoginsengisoli TaxID=1578198 RepID=A0A417YR31_9BACI|nr:transglutaminase-like domain-containing protein [Neobacillus notoginsengisoli]RHW37196.1 transglutaminase domain-containing protein [Neobacillus notoginsengisoli]